MLICGCPILFSFLPNRLDSLNEIILTVYNMAFVKNITIQDNAAPAAATSRLVAQRLGKTLRDRYEKYIHKRECSPEQSDYEVKMASRSLAAFSIYNLACVDDEAAGASVCDSSVDGGIDGICVNHTEKVVVVVQSKINQSGSSTWTKADFLSFKHACEKLQLEEFERFDEILKDMSPDIEIGLDSLDYRFLFVMTHTGKRGAAKDILEDMQTWQDELNEAALTAENVTQEKLPFQVHLVSAEDLTEWLQAGTQINIDLEDVELDHYGKMVEPHTAFYGQVTGDQILEWWTSHSTRLFSKNIRNLLGSTDVNESIRETTINNPELFWYYNNGITLLVSEISPHRRNANRSTERGSFTFYNASIINGAQTVSTIGQVFKDADAELMKKLSSIRVPARFIRVNENDNVEVARAITKANNHQNRVLGRDFASQHPEQLRISRELAVDNYQYQLLRTSNQYNNQEADVIDLDEALNGLACLTMRDSILTTLKSQRGKFFDNLDGSLYRTIFNPQVSGVKVINAVLHFRVIESLLNSKLDSIDKGLHRKRHLIVTHGNRVFAGILLQKVCQISSATEIITPNEGRLSTMLDLIVSHTEDYIETHHTNAYPARFFANVVKVAGVLEVLSQVVAAEN